MIICLMKPSTLPISIKDDKFYVIAKGDQRYPLFSWSATSLYDKWQFESLSHRDNKFPKSIEILPIVFPTTVHTLVVLLNQIHSIIARISFLFSKI